MSPGRARLAPAWCQHLDAVFRRLRRRARQSGSALDVSELGRRRGPGRNAVAELCEEPLEAAGATVHSSLAGVSVMLRKAWGALAGMFAESPASNRTGGRSRSCTSIDPASTRKHSSKL